MLSSSVPFIVLSSASIIKPHQKLQDLSTSTDAVNLLANPGVLRKETDNDEAPVVLLRDVVKIDREKVRLHNVARSPTSGEVSYLLVDVINLGFATKVK